MSACCWATCLANVALVVQSGGELAPDAHAATPSASRPAAANAVGERLMIVVLINLIFSL
jgi:hypothetical protein